MEIRRKEFNYIFTLFNHISLLLKSETSDIELVVKLSNGNIKAFDQLFYRYSPILYAFGLKYLKSPVEAEELVQSVFMKIWENHEMLKSESSFKSYLFTIAYHDICKLFRRRKYWHRYLGQMQTTDSQLTLKSEEDLDNLLMLDLVRQVVEELPEKLKTIFVKSKIEGKSTKEIAETLHLSPGTVDNYISEALKFVRSRLDEKTQIK